MLGIPHGAYGGLPHRLLSDFLDGGNCRVFELSDVIVNVTCLGLVLTRGWRVHVEQERRREKLLRKNRDVICCHSLGLCPCGFLIQARVGAWLLVQE